MVATQETGRLPRDLKGLRKRLKRWVAGIVVYSEIGAVDACSPPRLLLQLRLRNRLHEFMKTHPIHRRGGFTLVELLVVIAIIAVLAGVGTPVYMKTLNNAKKEAATVFARQIEQSVSSFYTDQQVMPAPAGVQSVEGGTKFVTDSVEGLKVVNILAGLEEEVNTRRVKYLTPKEAKAKKDGAVYNKNGTEIIGLFDPWGNPYTIVLDTNYEERIRVKPGKVETRLNGRRAAVYSPGQDKKYGTGDDVKTWN
jgi:prepilin-type N-terminal cleavage/methylation domain-containing protein